MYDKIKLYQHHNADAFCCQGGSYEQEGIHHAAKGGGQILVCVAGRGYYQEWGKAPQELHPGDVVNIPPEVKHWHGAAPDCWFSHLAVEVPGEDTSNEWCEPVAEEAYGMLR